MAEYAAGSIKHDLASGSVAIRTSFPEIGDLANHAWLVATTGSGAISKTSADVQDWPDIPIVPTYPTTEPVAPAVTA